MQHLTQLILDFPGGAVGKNLLANTEDTGLILGLRTSDMLRIKLSLYATTTKLGLYGLRAATTEAPQHHS